MADVNIEVAIDTYVKVTDTKKKEAMENLAHSLDIF